MYVPLGSYGFFVFFFFFICFGVPRLCILHEFVIRFFIFFAIGIWLRRSHMHYWLLVIIVIIVVVLLVSD